MPTPLADVPSWEQDAAPFWSAAADGRLVLQHCDGCARFVHYPRSHCPYCLSSRLSWQESAGVGSVHSFTAVHRGLPSAEQTTPYVVALIDLDEGVRIMSNIVDCPVEDISIGMRVQVRFARRHGRSVPLFTAA